MLVCYSVIVSYLTILTFLLVYCIHRYYILFTYFRYKGHPFTFKPPQEKLPSITVQLPVYNEMYVIRRLLDAVVRLDYPKELLEIQVLDDSTDETSRIARGHIAKLRAEGHVISYLHRDKRDGYKAGALQDGLEQAKGELILSNKEHGIREE